MGKKAAGDFKGRMSPFGPQHFGFLPAARKCFRVFSACFRVSGCVENAPDAGKAAESRGERSIAYIGRIRDGSRASLPVGIRCWDPHPIQHRTHGHPAPFFVLNPRLFRPLCCREGLGAGEIAQNE